MGLRRVAAVAGASLALATLASAPAGATPRRHAGPLAPLEANVLVAINAIRAQHHLRALRLSSPLELAARAHSEQMAADGYFAHESADGSAFWRRVQSFYRSSPWRVWSVGENLLWSSPDVDARRALELWLASPEHRKNLLNPSWREIGVSAVHVTHARGVFHGSDVTVVTTDFGVRHA
jgi:uncharacterized protein YkwD